MPMKTPLTKEKVRNHFTYGWWKYLLLGLIAIFGWNLFYTMTRYRPPEEKRIVVGMYLPGDEEAMTDYLAQINATEMPDMEEMIAMYVVTDETYGNMVFSTHVAAGEGDVYLLDTSFFQTYAAQGAFKPLETAEELIALLEAEEKSLARGWRSELETKERHLYAIPGSELPGISRFVYNPDDTFVAVAINNGNDENVDLFMRLFVEDMLEDPVEQVPATATDLPAE